MVISHNPIQDACASRSMISQALSDLEIIRPHQTKEAFIMFQNMLLNNLVKTQDAIISYLDYTIKEA